MIYVVAALYDANNTPIGLEFTILDSSIQPGEKIGFEMTAFSMPKDVTRDAVANTVVYAFPYQYQF